jgi:hypothetical protein
LYGAPIFKIPMGPRRLDLASELDSTPTFNPIGSVFCFFLRTSLMHCHHFFFAQAQ